MLTKVTHYNSTILHVRGWDHTLCQDKLKSILMHYIYM